jgi:hypothetical protein
MWTNLTLDRIQNLAILCVYAKYNRVSIELVDIIWCIREIY